jgi:hypothetical protein
MIEIYLNDAECKNFLEPDRWARECCVSYTGVSISDVSDVSVSFDEIGVYSFGNAADAAWFTLMWRAVK